jgi:hypothetical protein
MKRLLLVVFTFPLLSIAILAQTPSPTVATTPNPTINQAVASPSPNPTHPILPTAVIWFASSVMLSSVIGVFVVVLLTQNLRLRSIGPRHIQFVSVCLIVPTILILGLEKVLTSETTATLIGGLAGYLLSGLGRYEPKPPESDNDKREAKSLTSTRGESGSEDDQNTLGRMGDVSGRMGDVSR